MREISNIAGLQRRQVGVLLAAGTAVISGIAIFVNGYGVRAWVEISDPTTYTTLKNSVAAMILLGVAVSFSKGRSGGVDLSDVKKAWPGLALIAIVGGSIPFVLFFEGLARATASDASFIHKTLLVWVAVLGALILRERIGLVHIAAIALLVGGQVALSGGVGAIEFGAGEWMILAATLLWAIETVIAKRVLASVPSHIVGVSRMAGGAVLLVVYGIGRGAFSGLTGVTPEHVLWIVVTGLTLSAYVATWFAALARARAVDVTAALVGGAIITALLEVGLRGVGLPPVLGLVLVAVGVLVVFAAGWRRPVTAQ
ncbi:MAG TPA: DMT family transporter [Acidimicrobiia bacterium]